MDLTNIGLTTARQVLDVLRQDAALQAWGREHYQRPVQASLGWDPARPDEEAGLPGVLLLGCEQEHGLVAHEHTLFLGLALAVEEPGCEQVLSPTGEVLGHEYAGFARVQELHGLVTRCLFGARLGNIKAHQSQYENAHPLHVEYLLLGIALQASHER